MQQNRNFATQFNKVITFENSIPYLYRYEDEVWIDEFFKNGRIKLSTFLNYKKYDDNQLGDKHEGFSMTFLDGNNDMFFSQATTVGFNAYCFCTSTIYDRNLKDTFNRNSVFRIDDPLNFMFEIAGSIQRIGSVLFGNCIYLENKLISEQIDKPIKTSMSEGVGIEAHSTAFMNKRYFLKDMKYQPQSEYRMLFFAERIDEKGLIIDCPEATRFCSRL